MCPIVNNHDLPELFKVVPRGLLPYLSYIPGNWERYRSPSAKAVITPQHRSLFFQCRRASPKSSGEREQVSLSPAPSSRPEYRSGSEACVDRSGDFRRGGAPHVAVEQVLCLNYRICSCRDSLRKGLKITPSLNAVFGAILQPVFAFSEKFFFGQPQVTL